MKIIIQQPVTCQAIYIRRFDGGTVATKMGKAGIVKQDGDDVGRTFRWLRPPGHTRFRVFYGSSDHTGEFI